MVLKMIMKLLNYSYKIFKLSKKIIFSLSCCFLYAAIQGIFMYRDRRVIRNCSRKIYFDLILI